jgi:hypothetical protein
MSSALLDFRIPDRASPDGNVTRHIMVVEGKYERLKLSGDHARQLGRALIATADEAEQMASYDTK